MGRNGFLVKNGLSLDGVGLVKPAMENTCRGHIWTD